VQRHAAAPDFVKFPRLVVLVDIAPELILAVFGNRGDQTVSLLLDQQILWGELCGTDKASGRRCRSDLLALLLQKRLRPSRLETFPHIATAKVLMHVLRDQVA